jgi:hypothetical protein
MDVFQPFMLNQKIDNEVMLFSVLDTLVMLMVEVEIRKMIQDDEE